MTKKFKDLKIEEFIKFCRKQRNCYICPIYNKFDLEICTIYELYDNEEIREYEVEIDGEEKV